MHKLKNKISQKDVKERAARIGCTGQEITKNREQEKDRKTGQNSQPGTAKGKVSRLSSEATPTSYVHAQEVSVANNRGKRQKRMMSKKKGNGGRLEGILEISSAQLKKDSQKRDTYFLRYD